MVPMHRLLMFALLAISLTFDVAPSRACSCIPADAQLWSPSGRGPAPLNARVTVLVPTHGSAGQVLVRRVGGTAIDVSEQVHDIGEMRVAVLVPKRPLTANTRYEVALTNRPRHPKTLVFGTFATGDRNDDQAPSFARPTAVDYFAETRSRMTSCQSRERWIEIRQAAAIDAREHSSVVYGVWLTTGGKPDVTAPPNWLLPMDGDLLVIGARHMCSSLRPDLPKGQRAALAVAAFDDAGNRSTVHQLMVTMTP